MINNLEIGDRLREEGVSAVLAADTAPHRDYRELVAEAMAELIAEGQQFDAEDVRHRVEANHPEAVAHSPNVIPAVFARASQAGRIVPVAFRKASRSSRHGSRNLVWRGAA